MSPWFENSTTSIAILSIAPTYLFISPEGSSKLKNGVSEQHSHKFDKKYIVEYYTRHDTNEKCKVTRQDLEISYLLVVLDSVIIWNKIIPPPLHLV